MRELTAPNDPPSFCLTTKRTVLHELKRKIPYVKDKQIQPRPARAGSGSARADRVRTATGREGQRRTREKRSPPAGRTADSGAASGPAIDLTRLRRRRAD